MRENTIVNVMDKRCSSLLTCNVHSFNIFVKISFEIFYLEDMGFLKLEGKPLKDHQVNIVGKVKLNFHPEVVNIISKAHFNID